MELLQKLTLYDLFGYTLPGVLTLMLYGWDGTSYWMDDITLGSLALLIVLGYVIGVMIAEFAEFIEGLLHKKISDNAVAKYWRGICSTYGISAKKVNDALKQAKVTEDDQNECVDMLVKKYITYMYSEIQADPQYSRLHNYASAELLYKNMAVVAVYAIVLGIVQQQISEIVIGVIGAVLFVRRRIRFSERSRGYAICWFVQKYEK